MGVDRWNKQLRAFARIRGKPVRQSKRFLVESFLELKSQQLRSHPAFRGTKGRARAKRLARSARVSFLERVYPLEKGRRDRLNRPSVLLFKPKDDLLRDAFAPNFCQEFVPMQRRLRQQGTVEIDLVNFSFAKEPGLALSRLKNVAEQAAKAADIRINFRDSNCDDITPYIVLAHLHRSLPPVFSGGRISNSVHQVADAVGMRNPLRIGAIKSRRPKLERLNKMPKPLVNAFKMHYRNPPGTFGDEDHLLRPQLKEYVADRFVDTLNSWIGEHELELTDSAAGSFIRAIGEALDNAERHGESVRGTDGQWSIAAFSKLIIDRNNEPLLQCSVGIVSVGATISESLNSASPRVREQIGRYVDRHSAWDRSAERVERLRTVMALQDGITRDAEASEARRGGVGFMELIDVFAELGDNGRADRPSVFTIISGRTCIRVTAPYQQGNRGNGRWTRELWFNEENDPRKPPSKEHVLTLDTAFPGVILSACFAIDPEHLRRKLDDDDTDHVKAD